LADDVYNVLETLELEGVVLVGHSIAGEELSSLGARDLERIAGLIYLDAAADRRGMTEDPMFQRFREELPQPPPPPSDPEEFREIFGFVMPEVELRNPHRNTHAGRAIIAGVAKPEYERIRVPTLAIYAVSRSPADLAPWQQTEDPQQLELLQEVFEHGTAQRQKHIEAFRRSRRPRVVDLEGANHYVFLTNRADVLHEVRAFLKNLDANPT
jgi:pimeloyl-ACP methyl ester carboxylesterase